MQSSAGPPPIKLVNSPKLLMPLRHQWCPMSPDACPCTHITTLLFVLVSVSTGLASSLGRASTGTEHAFALSFKGVHAIIPME